jgi:hypothetical protein
MDVVVDGLVREGFEKSDFMVPILKHYAADKALALWSKSFS